MKNKFLLALGAFGLLAVTACSSIPLLSTPQDALNAADAGVAAIEAVYASTCATGVAAAICTPQDQAEAAQLEQALTAAIGTAQAAINIYSGAVAGSPPTQAQIDDAIASVSKAVVNFSEFVNGLSAKKAAFLKARLHPGG